MWPRIIPFAVYMGFIGLSSLLSLVVDGNEAVRNLDLWLYPVKILVVGGVLVFLWKRYEELKSPVLANWKEGVAVLGVGLLVYVFWVRMDWSWAMQGELEGYDPFQMGQGMGFILSAFRLVGASVVVPIMEELFWRSFLIRWIINSRFETIPLGTFTLGSFLITVVLFGLEHNLWLAGMMAGAAYNLLLYRTGRIWPCVLAHSLTNLMLGIHVLTTQEWQWW